MLATCALESAHAGERRHEGDIPAFAKAPAGQAAMFTYEDFLLFPDDGKRHELIDGEHYVTRLPIRNIRSF